MGEFLYYCKSCNTLDSDSEDNLSLRCPQCTQRYYPLHITDDEWNDIDNEERRNVLIRAIMPQVNNRSQNQLNSNSRQSNNNQGFTANYSSSDRYSENDYNDEDDYDETDNRGNYKYVHNSGNRSNKEHNSNVNRGNYGEKYLEKNNTAKASGMSIAAFIFAFIFSIVGLILGIIDLSKKDGRKRGLSIAAVIISSIILLIIAISTGSGSSDKKEANNVNSPSASEFTVSNDSQNTNPQDKDLTTSEANASVVAAQSSGFSINEQVLVDQDGVKITAVEYENDSIWGDGIKMLLENNTSQNLMYSCDALIVNDYMISELFAQSVAAGKSAYETLHLSSSQLKEAGIENIGKIEIYFRIYDNDTWDDLFKTGCVTLQTSEYDNMDNTVNNEGLELYNNNDIRITAQYVDENSFWGKAILLYVENNRSENITVSVDDLSINGFMFAPMYSDTIYAGKKSFNDITLFGSELEENGVTEVKDVELKFKIYNSETYSDIDNTDSISFSVN